jgi:hypothetical protein
MVDMEQAGQAASAADPPERARFPEDRSPFANRRPVIPAPPEPATPTVTDDAASTEPEPQVVEPAGPQLPPAPPRLPTPIGRAYTPPPDATTWYRTDQQRYRSVYRRANPWYRRLARAVVGLAVVGVIGVGVVVGVSALSDYLNRDKLPAPGAEPIGFRSTSFLVRSSAPGPELYGTLRIDTSTGAYQFVGGVGGPQADLELVSPDGARVYLRANGGSWREASEDDEIAIDLVEVVPYLRNVVDSDDVLVPNLRKGSYVELVDQVELGRDADAVDRYEMVIDTARFAADYPLQWESFRSDVVPGMIEGRAVPLTMSVDSNDVVVALEDDQTHFTWQRLGYESAEFTPLDPAAASAALSAG